jgi:hypothetical protein
MATIHTALRQYKDTSSTPIQLQETITGDAEYNLNVASLAVAANTEFLLAYTRANLQSLCIYASGAVTVYTNAPSTGAPQDTIPLVGGQALIWTLQTDGLSKCPFSSNVTAVYVTNAGSGAVQFKIRAIVNQ